MESLTHDEIIEATTKPSSKLPRVECKKKKSLSDRVKVFFSGETCTDFRDANDLYSSISECLGSAADEKNHYRLESAKQLAVLDPSGAVGLAFALGVRVAMDIVSEEFVKSGLFSPRKG